MLKEAPWEHPRCLLPTSVRGESFNEGGEREERETDRVLCGTEKANFAWLIVWASQVPRAPPRPWRWTRSRTATPRSPGCPAPITAAPSGGTSSRPRPPSPWAGRRWTQVTLASSLVGNSSKPLLQAKSESESQKIYVTQLTYTEDLDASYRVKRDYLLVQKCRQLNCSRLLCCTACST